MRQLCEHLPKLAEITSQEVRAAVELTIDTGRRPEEVCDLMGDVVVEVEVGHPRQAARLAAIRASISGWCRR